MQNWRRNLIVAWISQLLSILAFSSVFSFLPFYLQDLGVTDPDQIKLWTGWITTGGAVSMAIFAPIWGSLADRRGRKIMVQRAAFGGAVTMMLMALVTSAWQFLIMRTIQGTLTGTIAAFTALVASTTPREKSGLSLGLMQVAVYSGFSGGPLVGGLLADALGYRTTFAASGLMLLFSGILSSFLLQEQFTPRSSRRVNAWQQASALLVHKTILPILVVILSLYLTSSVARPILPIFIQSLEPNQERLATITGLIQGASSLSSAIAAALIGAVSDRFGHRRVLLVSALGAAAAYFPMALVTTSTQLFFLNLLVGVFAGGLMPASNAFIALHVDEGKQGVTYGLTASAGSAGRALGPLLGSFVAVSLGTRALFPVAAALYVLIAIWVGIALPCISQRTVEEDLLSG